MLRATLSRSDRCFCSFDNAWDATNNGMFVVSLFILLVMLIDDLGLYRQGYRMPR
jgi:hypothetical protein